MSLETLFHESPVVGWLAIALCSSLGMEMVEEVQESHTLRNYEDWSPVNPFRESICLQLRMSSSKRSSASLHCYLPLMDCGQVGNDFRKISQDIRAVPYPVWKGELYLELHQGTFTSQAKIKAQNRACEMLLRGLEALHALCLLGIQKDLLSLTEEGLLYVVSLSGKIVSLWKDTLLNQFHDVIRKFPS